MENPATWGKAERVVSEVIANHQYNIAQAQADPGRMHVGLSLTRQITDALRREGLLADEEH